MSEYSPEREPAGPEGSAPHTPTRHAPTGEADVRRDSTVPARETSRAGLLPADETHSFKTRWSDIQAAFVDQPHEAVNQADRLAEEIIERFSTIFVDERRRLGNQWVEGEKVSTEDLRLTLRRYRSLIDRLLSS